MKNKKNKQLMPAGAKKLVRVWTCIVILVGTIKLADRVCFLGIHTRPSDIVFDGCICFTVIRFLF